MDWLGGVLGVLIAGVLADVARHLFSTRPELVRRRQSRRPLLVASTFSALLGALAWFMALAAGTSGYAEDRDDAAVFLAIGLVRLVVAICLYVLWWRLAGRDDLSRR